MCKAGLILSLVFLAAAPALSLEPNEILVIANSDITESVEIGRHYCARRAVPADNILNLPLGAGLRDWIARDDYEKQFAEPIRRHRLPIADGQAPLTARRSSLAAAPSRSRRGLRDAP